MGQKVIHVGGSTFYQGGKRTEKEWEAATTQLLEESRNFVACDLARTGIELYPQNPRLRQLCAQALLRTGAVDQARAILEPMCNALRPDNDTLGRLYERFRDSIQTLSSGESSAAGQATISSLFEELAGAIQRVQNRANADEESLGLLGRTYKDLWRRRRIELDSHGADVDFARLSRDTYLRGFRTSRGIYTGVNAASMSWILGERELASELAAEVLAIASSQSRRDFWHYATLGEAYLIEGNHPAALESYGRAAELVGIRYSYLVSAIQQLRLLEAQGMELPPQLLADPGDPPQTGSVLNPPTVVLFVGHMVDRPGQERARFPANREHEVRAAIDETLDSIDARIGFCSAACGSDLLFVEAMLSRDAEVNLLLPFHLSDFVETSVRFAGPEWERRFHRALRLANSVKYATEERSLRDDELFDYGNRVAHGFAELRAQTLETSPILVAVWDGGDVGGRGGTAEVVQSWASPKRRRIIQLCELLASQPQDADGIASLGSAFPDSVPPASGPAHNRSIKTLLFADVVGYSKLHEADTPFYMYEFLHRVASTLADVAPAPEMVNTWGDAIFVVMNDPVELLDYALALRKTVEDTNWLAEGLSADMSLRIALHAGPVFSGKDPMTGRTNHYGSHVNRAARIEPITTPGSIYASEQFVTLLAAEIVPSARAEGRAPKYVYEYVGTLPLAKRFGQQAVYEVRESP